MAGTGVLILGAILGAGALWIYSKHKKHEKKEHFKHRMHMMHEGKNFVHHPHGRKNMGMHHVKGMLHQDILNRTRHPIEVHRNHHRLMMKIEQYEVMLRPLLLQRVTGKITERQFHNHLRSIEDQICEELDLPMRHDPHHIMRDMINHDGSTTDMDNGHDGDNTPSMDNWLYESNAAFSDPRNRPHIHDLSARNHLAALAAIGDDDDIHHINLRGAVSGLARSNNVELADDYDFQHTPYPNLAIQNVFTEDGDEPL